MTDYQREILEHSLGLGYSKMPYRNQFATAPDCDGYSDVIVLVEAGLMIRGRDIPGGMIYFHVTDAGAKLVGSQLPND